MINCIYGHGDFHSDSIVATTGCLQGYALALVPTGIIIVLAPAFYARGNYIIPMRGACFSLILNGILNSIMVFGFGWGAISVTIATSISSWINAMYLYTKLKNELGPLLSESGLKSCSTTVLVSTITSLFVFFLISMWTFPPVFFNAWISSGERIPHTFLAQLSHLMLPFSLFAIILFLCARIFRARDILSIIQRAHAHPE